MQIPSHSTSLCLFVRGCACTRTSRDSHDEPTPRLSGVTHTCIPSRCVPTTMSQWAAHEQPVLCVLPGSQWKWETGAEQSATSCQQQQSLGEGRVRGREGSSRSNDQSAHMIHTLSRRSLRVFPFWVTMLLLCPLFNHIWSQLWLQSCAQSRWRAQVCVPLCKQLLDLIMLFYESR